MRLVSWNVQWCRGVDGVVDPARIAAELRRIADPDVACLQEIASGFTDLAGSRGEDQPAIFGRELPHHEAVVGWGTDVPGSGRARKRFGNMILSRLPLGRVRRHSLPWPPSPREPSMPRVAVEAIVDAPIGTLRIVSTHLEYYSAEHRAAQLARLGALKLEWLAERKPVDEEGPFRSQPSPASTIVCGDFNLPPDDPAHQQILDIGFVDAWEALHPTVPHPATFKVHERDEGESPYCCDYAFVTPDLVPRLRSIRVDADNSASDHQPLILELA
ncbi:MAG TPA: endonuclease/exonuclease/phosphatase family protein [Burkholderiales bacterium]|nr:endonuclease/exonuclease/phosphatase family protein [Burkholderiales bacterium]